MRVKLAKLDNVRDSFTGTFERMGEKTNYYNNTIEETVLLKDIKDKDNNKITDHLWFNYTKGFEKLGDLNEGDIISFDARVKLYEKLSPLAKKHKLDRYDPNKYVCDYKLSHPTKIKIIKKNEEYE